MRKMTFALAAAAIALCAVQANAEGATTLKIGVLNDQSGLYADMGGVGSVVAAKLAVEDSGLAGKGWKIEVLGADHQNKADIASNIARRWFDVDGVDVITGVTNSAVALALSSLARDKLYDLGAEVSTLLVQRAVEAIGVPVSEIGSYGKAAIIGANGEIEHAAALIHPKFGAPVRSAVEGKDIIPSTKKIGAPGAAITFPLTGKETIWAFDHMDAAEIVIPDSPRADEAVVILAVATGGRPLHRIKLPG